MFRYRALAVLLLVVPCLLALSGCGTKQANGPASVPPWLLTWHPPEGGFPPNLPVQAAFAQGTKLLHFSEEMPLPDGATTWLAAGDNVGLALVRLDPRSQFQDVVIMNRDATHNWEQNSTALKAGQDCIDGQVVASEVRFPEPVCSNGTLTQALRADTSWQYSITSWFSTIHVYVLSHMTSAVAQATGAKNVHVGSKTGWQTQEKELTSVVVPLGSEETFVFATSGSPSECLALADEMLSHLGEFAPLP